eukprot:CAMPEP_0202403868 /NCGR_PEP_ID=MMETSP1128-20130828/5267_1 /ASSEMBLY_ACC=CAM_ASM_000463 /TAXON_ID=3047 /ORGANISM="Dunaliella tertiolecta, Strain CCMP1320" /LENGTH=37 /DNA_ID= /DNA_START= /DNA_END= /DNA_ORIENTATION=
MAGPHLKVLGMQDLDTPRGGQEYSSGMFCLAWYMRYP